MSGATARLALPYPTGPDTPDVPRDVLALANRLEGLLDPTALALPATPYDGQVAYLPVAAGVVWAFRWNAGSASPYKWEFVGGPSWHVDQTADLNINPTVASAYVDDAGQPALTVPRIGAYLIQMGGNFSTLTAGGPTMQLELFMTPSGGALTDSGYGITGTLLSANWYWPAYRQVAIGFSAGSAPVALKLRAVATVAGMNVTFGRRFLAVMPLRVG
jgi:hypothetical protein